ncbi:uncharacterized protein LOC7494881 isoform X9 [Populus trichocarpa]|uniref:uncharacterized protein LOC7494881 isoform X7 n=1 Tax=Populus trichocarpa TaxID=3694 RepID=UPI002277C0DA|nr:uncharacterized protein LOC7494881 isoform X7 [Populus trichocarpa]XP_052311089.1 uncharacterized protein LOC7494881 isoform X8 [Populus trichocarpa]XP_052311090.1 uncharacterized protein LOC7494881 isoform X9 [Populus trichocarpa]
MTTTNISPSSIVVEVLRGDNYDDWSACMKSYMLAQDLWDFIEPSTGHHEGDQEVDSKPIDHQEGDSKALRKKNAAALHAIQISCAPNILSKIRSITSAKVAWDTLANLQQQNSPSHKEQSVEAEPSEDDESLGSEQSVEAEPAEDDESQGSGSVSYGINGPLLTLYKYAHIGDWDATKNYLSQYPNAKKARIKPYGRTALHVAACAGNLTIVEELVKMMSEEELEIQDDEGSTALFSAATVGITKMAECLVSKNKNLVTFVNAQKRIPLDGACTGNNKDMALYLYSVTPFEFLCQGNGHHGSYFLQCALGAQMLDIVLDFLHRCPRFATTMNEVLRTNALIYLSKMPQTFPSASRLAFWQRWIYSCIPMQSIATTDDNVRINMPDQSLSESKNIILQVSSKLRGFAINLLAFLGIKQIYDLKKIHIYSDKILRCMYGNGRNLFMSSIANRQEKVFSLFYGLEAGGAEFVSIVYGSGNTMLHLAAKLSPPSQLARISGAALQMQRELQWYKEVESIVDPTDNDYYNKDNQTPRELFTSDHKDLVVKGEKWMKQAATSCTVVGALIITIMFTVAFTVPGGNVQETGYPVFKDEKSFTVFIVADAISLFSSSTSVLMFLGILTSRYAEEDFLKSLPTKLIIGLSMLFFSIAAMMVTFCAALIIMLDGRLQVIIPIVLLATIPVTLFMLLQFPLLVEIGVSTYGPGIFNRKMKRWSKSSTDRLLEVNSLLSQTV